MVRTDKEFTHEHREVLSCHFRLHRHYDCERVIESNWRPWCANARWHGDSNRFVRLASPVRSFFILAECAGDWNSILRLSLLILRQRRFLRRILTETLQCVTVHGSLTKVEQDLQQGSVCCNTPPSTLGKLARMRKALQHEEPNHVPISDFPWSSFLDRWRRELNLSSEADPYRYYDFPWIVTVPREDPHIKPSRSSVRAGTRCWSRSASGPFCANVWTCRCPGKCRRRPTVCSTVELSTGLSPACST